MSILKINGSEYINYSWIKENLNISSHRVKRWREGRGGAKTNPLHYLEINKTLFLYKKEDILFLYEDLKNKKVNG